VFDDEASLLGRRNEFGALNTTADSHELGPGRHGGGGCCGACRRCCGDVAKLGPAIRVGVFVFLTVLPAILAKPSLVEVKKDYFGSDKKAALVGSVIDACVATVNLFLAVLFGRALDAFGRRPFFLITGLLTVITYGLLAAFPETPIFFMGGQAMLGLVQGSYMTSYLADVASPEMRPKFFAVTAAVSTFVLIFGLFSALLDVSNRVTFLIGAAVAGAGLLYAFFAIPESLSEEKRTPMKAAGAFNPLSGMGVLFRSRVLILCTIIIVVTKVADIGVGEVYGFYLNERVGFNKKDFGFLFAEVALVAPVALLVVMPLMLKYLSPSLVMCVALVANAAVAVMIATVWAKWPIFAFATPVAGVMLMISPIVQGIVTNAGSEADLAKRLTALVAVGDVCGAIAPLPFGVLYSQLHGEMAAIPFFVSAGLCCLSAYLSTRMSAAVELDVANEVMDETGADTDSLVEDSVADLIAQRTEARMAAASFAGPATRAGGEQLLGGAASVPRLGGQNSQPRLRSQPRLHSESQGRLE
jgi:DHA1 family tetracycline resistance protein-like MFS transporter